MYSRAARATSSRRAKQELVRLLFGSKYSKSGPEAHQKLDHSIYSYAELRSAYLERIQTIHPDKSHSSPQGGREKTKRDEFVALQEAWRKYDDFAKMMRRVDGDEMEASFTLFGVGCSFADNEAERALREEITDQACRGWFSSGSLGIGNKDHDRKAAEQMRGNQPSLLSDDLFSPADQEQSSPEKDTKNQGDDAHPKTPRKSLIGHLVPPHRK